MVELAGDTVIDVNVPPFLPQLMKPIVAATSAATMIRSYFKIFIILILPGIP